MRYDTKEETIKGIILFASDLQSVYKKLVAWTNCVFRFDVNI